MSAKPRPEDVVEIRPWEITWNGRTWRDMPGGDEMTRKCNFALYRRGLLDSEESDDPDDVMESGLRRLVPVKRSGGAQRVSARRSEERRERIAEMEAKRAAEEEMRRLQGRLQMRLTVWSHQNGALEQIAARAVVDSGSLSKLRMTGRGLGGERAKRLEAVLDELEAGRWTLNPRRKRAKVKRVLCPPGHVPFKEYLVAAAAARAVAKHSLYVWLQRHPEDMPPIVKVHGRAWFVPCSAMPGAWGRGEGSKLKNERRAA